MFGASPPHLLTPVPGPASEAWIDRLAQAESPAFTARRARRSERSGTPQDPIVWTAAKGANVRDIDGNVFVDFTSGFGAAAIGHRNKAVEDAVRAQSARLVHGLGDLHPSDTKIELLERLCELSPFDDARAILGLSGSDAVEAALKTALLASGRPGVLAFDGGYHGLSHGPLSACGYAEKFRAPFQDQLNPHVQFAPYGQDPGPLNAHVGAVLVEPILGRGGVHVPPPEFLATLRARCDAAGAILIADEIFTGLGRCGLRWRSGTFSDLLCVGKALGGGYPVSACIGRANVMRAWGEGAGEALHTGTFFGHPSGCAAALASLDEIERNNLAKRAEVEGAYFAQALDGVHVRGEALMLGLETDADPLRLVGALMRRGFLTLPAGPNAVQLTPPLTIARSLLDAFAAALPGAIQEASS